MRETKRFGGHVIETKVKRVNGVEVGEISAYIAAWSLDRGLVPDKFVRGAFAGSIQEHRDRDMRQVRFKDHHGRTVGGFPIENVIEDAVGLFGIAEVNLEVQQGREVFSLARQKVLVDFSVGFIAQDKERVDGVRIIRRAELLEGSIVDEPLNIDAKVIQVKNFGSDFLVAPARHEWDPTAAATRIDETPFAEMKGCDPYLGDFLLADRIEGKTMIVPDAVMEAALELKSQDAPDPDQILVLEKLLARMDMSSPFDETKRQFFGIEEVKTWSSREFERALVRSGAFSKGAAKVLVKNFIGSQTPENDFAALLNDLQGATKAMEG